MNLLKNIFSDFRMLMTGPGMAFRTILSRSDWKLTKGYLIFILVMNTYYVFLPSYLLILNIVAILFFFILIGLCYYFMQEALIIYKEQCSHENSDEDMFYLIAYVFALCNIPAMLAAILVNIIAVSLNENLLIGVFWAIVWSFPVLLIAIYYPLRLFTYISDGKAQWSTMFELIIQSFITTCKEAVGFRAVRDILIDWKRI